MRWSVKVGLGASAFFFLLGLVGLRCSTDMEFFIFTYLGFSTGTLFIVIDNSPDDVKDPGNSLRDSTRWGALFGLLGMYLAPIWVKIGGGALVFTICLLIVCGAILLVLDKDFSDGQEQLREGGRE